MSQVGGYLPPMSFQSMSGLDARTSLTHLMNYEDEAVLTSDTVIPVPLQTQRVRR